MIPVWGMIRDKNMREKVNLRPGIKDIKEVVRDRKVFKCRAFGMEYTEYKVFGTEYTEYKVFGTEYQRI